MSKITFLSICTLFITNILSAQLPNWSWGHNYGGFNSDNIGLTASDNNGNVYLAGNFMEASVAIGPITYSNAGSINTGDFYIVKYSSDGTLLWSKKEGGIGFDDISSIAVTHDGGFIITGKFQQNIAFGTTTLSSAVNGVYLVKYDSDGNVIWAVEPSTGFYDESKIKVDSAGNIYMTGTTLGQFVTFGGITLTNENWTESGGNGSTFIVKMDNNGAVLWARNSQRTGSTPFSNISYDLAVDDSGNVFIGGTFFSDSITFGDITLTKAPGGFDHETFMVKYDINGNVAWAKASVSAGSPNTSAWAVTTDNSGNAYFSGWITGTVFFDSVAVNPGGSGSQLFIVKLDTSGQVAWAKSASGAGYSGTNSIDCDLEGNLYVAGTYFGGPINFGGTSLVGANSGSLFVTKYNSDGQPLYSRSAAPFNVNNRVSIDVYSSNEIYIAGYFFEPSVAFGPVSLTRTPTDDDCNIFIAKLNYQQLAVESFTDQMFKVYPNPNSGNFNIQLSANSGSNVTIDVHDLAGRAIFNSSLQKGLPEENVHLYDIQTGIYLVTVQDGANKTVKKVIVE